MVNSHYVPKLTLRKFADKLCVFNVNTGQYVENVNIDSLFSSKGFYSQEIEEKLNKKIESQFGNLLSNKILLANNSIELNRAEVALIKKFLLISVIRGIGSKELMQKEKFYYVRLNEYGKKYAAINGHEVKDINPPFIEKEIEGETEFDYWMRTLNVILDSDGTPESIMKHEYKTYPAYRWSTVINNGYIAFWDSEYDHDEFVITDIGMTSENEKGWNGITIHNVKKTNFLMSLLKNSSSKEEQQYIMQTLNMHSCFTENFMMFPISSRRMIVEIDPFYKFRIVNKNIYNMQKLEDLTNLNNEQLYYPNSNKYVYQQLPSHPIKRHPDDMYIYKISKLTSKETTYCNALFLDRINTWVGFSSLNKVVKSLFEYKKYCQFPKIPRVDYTELYKIISERYCSNIDTSNIKGWRR